MAWIYAENGCRSASTTASSQCTHSFCFKCRCVRSHTIHGIPHHCSGPCHAESWAFSITHIRIILLGIIRQMLCVVIYDSDNLQMICFAKCAARIIYLACVHWMLFAAFFKALARKLPWSNNRNGNGNAHKKSAIFSRSSRRGTGRERGDKARE